METHNIFLALLIILLLFEVGLETDVKRLVTYYELFIIRLSTHAVHIAGVTAVPNGAFMKQVARNLTDMADGFLLNSRHLIMDRDTKYTDDYRGRLDREGVKPVRCPARTPWGYAQLLLS